MIFNKYMGVRVERRREVMKAIVNLHSSDEVFFHSTQQRTSGVGGGDG